MLLVERGAALAKSENMFSALHAKIVKVLDDMETFPLTNNVSRGIPRMVMIMYQGGDVQNMYLRGGEFLSLKVCFNVV